MRKSERIAAVWLAAVNEGSFTARSFADRFGVSVRTMMRDLEELSGMGVPIYAEQGGGGGFRVLPGAPLPPISMTPDEARALLFALDILEGVGTGPFDAETAVLAEKVSASLRGGAAGPRPARVMFPFQRGEGPEPHLRPLYDAAEAGCAVRMGYAGRDGREDLTAFPIGVYPYLGKWYAVALVGERPPGEPASYRIFRTDRIEDVEVLSQAAAPKGTWTLREWEGLGFARQGQVEVVMALTQDALRRVTNRWMRGGEVSGEGDRLRLHFTCPKSQTAFVLANALALGPGAVVESPAWLREEAAAATRAMVQAYDDGPEEKGTEDE